MHQGSTIVFAKGLLASFASEVGSVLHFSALLALIPSMVVAFRQPEVRPVSQEAGTAAIARKEKLQAWWVAAVAGGLRWGPTWGSWRLWYWGHDQNKPQLAGTLGCFCFFGVTFIGMQGGEGQAEHCSVTLGSLRAAG